MMKIILFLLLSLPLLAACLDSSEEEPSGTIITENAETLRVISASYLREIKPIFERACFDCHSTLTRYPWYDKIPGIKQLIDSDIEEAQKHINMTNGLPFKGHGSIQKDLKAIQEVITEGDMPPWDYRLMHPDARLSLGDRETILKWIHENQ